MKELNSLFYHWLIFASFSLAAVTLGHAQPWSLQGQVVDAATQHPLPFAKVSLLQAHKGVLTDSLGRYQLQLATLPDTLRVSSIGYQAFVQAIDTAAIWGQVVQLLPSDYTLDAVVIRPEAERENPALRIMREVLAQKSRNNRDGLQAYQYETYSKMEFGFKNVDARIRDRLTQVGMDLIQNYVDSSRGHTYLPILMVESLSEVYARTRPKGKREEIKATRVSGVQNNSVARWLGDSHHFTNLYDNQLELLDRQFVSPLAQGTFAFYEFELLDSSWVDHHWCYELAFAPKRKQEPTFLGTLWVDTATYAIKEAELEVAGDANINYVQQIRLVQRFDLEHTYAWMLEREEMYVDGHILVPHLGSYQDFHGKRIASYRKFVIDAPKAPSFYAPKFRQLVAADAMNQSEAYWETHRHQQLSQREERVYTMVDSIKQAPFFKLMRTLVRGYAETGPVEWGPFSSLYSFNPVEGNRFRLGVRTNRALLENTQFETYLAYGTRDRAYKYGLSVRHLLSRRPWRMLQASYRHDLEQLGRSPTAALQQDNVLNSAFNRNPLNRMNLVEELSLSYSHDWFEGLFHRVRLSHRRLAPRGILQYHRYTEAGTLEEVPDIRTTEVQLHLHWGPREQFLNYDFSRISLGSYAPSLDVMYTKGLKGVFESPYDYHRLMIGLGQTLRLGILGELKVQTEAGKVWGNLPYPLLEIHSGNETFFYDEQAFNGMNFFEFVSDEYASAALSWYPQGLFLNHVPLLRKLKWREVATFKLLGGDLNLHNQRELELPETMHRLRQPYMEASVGVTNIFTFLRVDALWRLTHRSHAGIQPFGVYVTAEFSL